MVLFVHNVKLLLPILKIFFIVIPLCFRTDVFVNFIEITLRHGCSPVNVLHIFRTPFPRNTSEWLLLNVFVVIFTRINFSYFFINFSYTE